MLWVAVVAHMAIVTRNAWVCDDAFITLRTVDNFVHGRGLVWNVGERVQVYTHPLWMFVLSVPYFITREAFVTTMATSLVMSLLAASLLAVLARRSPTVGVVAIFCLSLSRAYIDFATSGLENSLSHVLVAGLVMSTLAAVAPGRLRLTAWLAAALALTRLDLSLFAAPMALWVFYETKKAVGLRKSLTIAAPAIFAVVGWEIFSILYYGVPFPNTAYAKLQLGIPRDELVRKGTQYLHNFGRTDPAGALTGIFGAVLTLASFKSLGRARAFALVLPSVLYCGYVVWIGADFMSGRFLTVTVIAGACLIANSTWLKSRWAAAALIGTVATAAALAPRSVFFWKPPTNPLEAIDESGVADEAAFYQTTSSLIAYVGGKRIEDHPWSQTALRDRERNGTHVFVKGSIGYYGYLVGPDNYVIDEYGLADPLLARLPPLFHVAWRPGHMRRAAPAGYLESVLNKENQLRHPELRALLTDLWLLSRAPIFSEERWAAIWRVNLGPKREIPSQGLRDAALVRATYEQVRTSRNERGEINATQFDAEGFEVSFAALRQDSKLTIDLVGNTKYRVFSFAKKERLMGATDLVLPEQQLGYSSRAHITLRRGTERIRVYPVELVRTDLFLVGFMLEPAPGL